MRHYKFLILGAGPTGLTLAHALADHGVAKDQILVLEKEAVAGGLCRSADVDGTALDIGGGHFLDIKRKNVLDFLFRFMPETEWNRFDRVSKIDLRGQRVDHPLESNLWQLDKNDQVDFLESIAQAGCVRGQPMPESFADWVTWKLGERIAKEYMLPYNRKIWSMPLSELGVYWLYKLPNVSFRETLQSCIMGAAFGALPAHGVFLYPKKYGYGEVWRRMGEKLGAGLRLNCPVASIDLERRIVNGEWSADVIVNTIPWTLWPKACDVPKEIVREIEVLKQASIDVDYVPDTIDDPSHWIYEPDEKRSYHRLLLRSNFCAGSKGYWTETNSVRAKPATSWRHRNEFAYPINTLGKPKAVEAINVWAASKGVVGAGRWGQWEHMNSDVAVAESLQLAQKLAQSHAARTSQPAGGMASATFE